MSDFTISDLENLKKLRNDLNETFDCLENMIAQIRDFNREIHNLEAQKTKKTLQRADRQRSDSRGILSER